MVNYYCKQVAPELQQDNLFYTHKNKNTQKYELAFEDDFYTERVIIFGNRDFYEHSTQAYEKVLKIDENYYEYEALINPHTNHCYWDNISDFINYYFSKENGKKYSTREIHAWKELLNGWYNYRYEEENTLKALELITGKKWRKDCIKGCCQREWQHIYVSEDITQKDIDYIEMCYFNTGSEWRIYESKEDLDNNESVFTLYVDSYNAKENLAEELGCSEDELVCLEFDGYTQTPKYKEI